MNPINRTEGIVAGFVILVLIISAIVYASYNAAAPAHAPSNPMASTTTDRTSTSTNPGAPAQTTQPAQPSEPVVPGPPQPEADMQTITATDNGASITLADHERFEIQLGSALSWSLTFDPANGITRVANSTTVNGIQGVYEAETPGTVKLTAIGAPICAAGQACPQFRQAVIVTFVIQ